MNKANNCSLEMLRYFVDQLQYKTYNNFILLNNHIQKLIDFWNIAYIFTFETNCSPSKLLQPI